MSNELLRSASVVQPPASVASTATTTMTFDTVDSNGVKYDFAIVRFGGGTQATTDPAITTLKFLESDLNTNASNMTAITALTGGTAGNTSSNFVIPAVIVTGLGCAIEFQVDLRKRKRFLQINVTPGTTLIYGIHVVLGRAKEIPVTAAQKSVLNKSATTVVGCAAIVNV